LSISVVPIVKEQLTLLSYKNKEKNMVNVDYATSQNNYRYWTGMCNQYWNNWCNLSCAQIAQGAIACDLMAQWREYHANQFFDGPDGTHQGYINNALNRSNHFRNAYQQGCMQPANP
jgi:hypothetical protein